MLCGSEPGEVRLRKRLPACNYLELCRQELDELQPMPDIPVRRSISEQIRELRGNQAEFNFNCPDSIEDSTEISTNKALVFAYVPETQKLEAKFTFSNVSERKLIYWISTPVSAQGRFKIPVWIGIINPEQKITAVVSAEPSAFGPNQEPLLNEQIVINTVPWQTGLNKMADILSHQKKSIKKNKNIQKAVISKLFVYRTPINPLANDLEVIDSILDPSAELIPEEDILQLNEKIAAERKKKANQVAIQERKAMNEAYESLLKEIWISGPPKFSFKAMTRDLYVLMFLLVLFFGILFWGK